MKTNHLFLVAILLVICSCSSETRRSDEAEKTQLLISVVNYPLYFFAKSIGGDDVKVYLPAIAGDPAYWRPEARQVLNFQKSELIFINGAGYAKWIEKVSLPSSKIVNTSLEFKDQWIETEEEAVHSHGPEGEHSHKGTAFTTWLDFSLAALQAKSIYEALVEKMPGKKEVFSKNYEDLNNKLLDLDKRANEIFKDLDGKTIIASHPVYQYLSAAYDIDMLSLHWEPDEMPDKGMWNAFQKTIQKNNVRFMLWEGEPLPEIRSRLEELNIDFAVFDPCANKPEAGDFLEIMDNNLGALVVKLKN